MRTDEREAHEFSSTYDAHKVILGKYMQHKQLVWHTVKIKPASGASHASAQIILGYTACQSGERADCQIAAARAHLEYLARVFKELFD